jgi:hypothetical protein
MLKKLLPTKCSLMRLWGSGEKRFQMKHSGKELKGPYIGIPGQGNPVVGLESWRSWHTVE